MKPLADAALDLAWLPPAGSTLLALTHLPADLSWAQLRQDPGLVLLLHRLNCPEPLASRRVLPILRESARKFLEESSAPIPDWKAPGSGLVQARAVEIAQTAENLAKHSGAGNPENAWAAGLLVPLGWQLACALMPQEVQQALQTAAAWPTARWGVDHPVLVRRLGRLWNLPPWLRDTLGNLSLPVEIAGPLGTDPRFLATIQLAVLWVQRSRPTGLRFPVGSSIEECCSFLGLQSHGLDSLFPTRPAAPALQGDLENAGQENLRHRLLLALQSPGILPTESPEPPSAPQADVRLQEMKLAALAELAAGAGHEINNPLAVISGQAQYAQRHLQQVESLLVEEPELTGLLDPLRTKIHHALQTIIGQTQRIHHLLTDLMNFARPPAPRWQKVRVEDLIQECFAALTDLAGSKKIRLEFPESAEEVVLEADPHQLRIALGNLLKNAIEAAPVEGWVRVQLIYDLPEKLTLVVEDNGPGPAPASCEHLFDPFFSGRNAGRGRGFGLPVAWRFARQNGGDVRYAGHEQGITRFLLQVNRGCQEPLLKRAS